MESARVQLAGNRIKATGRIVAAATANHPAFSVAYDLVTDEAGATRRLSVHVSTAERERQLSVARDQENMWLITGQEGESRESFKGAVDVDLMYSPLFNALAIRRAGLHRNAGSVSLPVVYIELPELGVVPATLTYTSSASQTSSGGAVVTVRSPITETEVVIDGDGFIIDYPVLAERI